MITALAVRICTVYALRGKTIAARVEDSPQNPLDDVIGDHIDVCVYTGEQHTKVMGREMGSGDTTFDLSLHIHLPELVTIPTANGVVKIGTRKAGGETAFNFLIRQIVRVLQVDESVWADLWRRLVVAVTEVCTIPFLIESEKGVRILAREMCITLETLCDPPFGPVEPDSVWSDLLSAMRAEPELASLADAIDEEISQPNGITDAGAIKAVLGLSADEFALTGHQPIVPEGSAAAQSFTMEGEDGDVFVVDSTSVDPSTLP